MVDQRATAPAPSRALTDRGNVAEDAGEQAELDEVLKDAEQAFGEIFSVRAPRDVLSGLWSGVQCVFSGFFLGIAGCIMQPIEGLRESGVTGALRGLALGLCTGVFFSVTGLFTGMFQAVRGVLATPRAICMFSKGWQWDIQESCWTEPILYSLPSEASKVFGGAAGDADEEEEDDGADGSRSTKRSRVVDSFYYDQLKVPSTASQREIRKAYFQQSRQWHPDKTADKGAKERFQAISEAYQVLSDPQRRRAYDQHGRQGAGDNFIDPQVFFSVLLGADALVPYVGQLRIAEMFGDDLLNPSAENENIDLVDDGAACEDFSKQLRQADKSDQRQIRRQLRLALALAERLDGYVRGNEEAYHRETIEEAQHLLQKDASLARFVAEIGFVYRNRGDLHLARSASRFGSFGARAIRLQLQGKGRKVGQQANTAKLAVSSLWNLRKIVNEVDAVAKKEDQSGNSSTAEETSASASSEFKSAPSNCNKTNNANADCGSSGSDVEEEVLPESWKQALPIFMETFWSLSAHDITGTLNRVTDRVLADTSVSSTDLCRRAEGLKILGTAFEEEAARVIASATNGSMVGTGDDASRDNSGNNSDADKRRRFEEAFVASLGGGSASAANGSG